MIESTLTERYQTTIPKGVREALGLRSGDKLTYRVEGDRVVVARASAESHDPWLGPFLDLIERDIRDRPAAPRPMTKAYVADLAALVAGVETDLGAALEED